MIIDTLRLDGSSTYIEDVYCKQYGNDCKQRNYYSRGPVATAPSSSVVGCLLELRTR
jgi:hypothetical protein